MIERFLNSEHLIQKTSEQAFTESTLPSLLLPLQVSFHNQTSPFKIKHFQKLHIFIAPIFILTLAH